MKSEEVRRDMNKLVCAECDSEIGCNQRIYSDVGDVKQQMKVTATMPCCGSVVSLRFSAN